MTKPFCLWGLFLAVVVAGAAIPWTAVDAQPIAQVDRAAVARSLFEQGLRFVDQERWGEALECFRRSRTMVERPNTIYNLGLASFRLGRHNDAIRAFEEYLHLPSVRRDRPQRERAARMRAESLAAVSTLQLFIEPGSSEVRVDGVLVSATNGGPVREILLDPGVHSLEAAAVEHQPHRETLSSLSGSRVVRRIALSRNAGGAPPDVRTAGSATSAEGSAGGIVPVPPGTPQPVAEPTQVPAVREAARAPEPVSRMNQAIACHADHGADRDAANLCVVQVLRGHCTSGPELSLLCATYREMGRREDTIDCMERYIRLDQNGPQVSSFQRYLNDNY